MPNWRSRKRKSRPRGGAGRKRIRVDGASKIARLSSPDWLLKPWAPLALAVPTVALLLLSRLISGVDAALDRHNSFFPSPIRLVYYAGFFAFGVGLHRVRGGMDVLAPRGWWLVLGAIPCFALRAWLLPMTGNPAR